jgi:hypothetical protein
MQAPRRHRRHALGIAIAAVAGLGAACTPSTAPAPAHSGATMTHRATGPFDVKTIPQPHTDGVGDPAIGRLALDKQFHGELEALSKGEMLATGNPAGGEAGYVAIERVVGTLQGRRGAFALQHLGTMSGGAQHMTIGVVPGSASDELAGLTGTMAIVIEGGKHRYVFDYDLPAAK